MKRNKILIYCDYGTVNINALFNELKLYYKNTNYELGFTDAENIKTKNALNDSVATFIMPGGFGKGYELKLQGIGNEKIRDFVKNGGNYLGICAGAYYACRDTIFEQDIPQLAITSQSGLDLIDGKAIGSLYKEFNIPPYTNVISPVAVPKIKYVDKQEYFSFYSGGPFFDTKGNDKIEILGFYVFDNGKNLPAIIKSQYGKGHVVLSGVHPEISGIDIKNYLPNMKVFDEAHKFADNLIKHEESRKKLFTKILSELSIKEK